MRRTVSRPVFGALALAVAASVALGTAPADAAASHSPIAGSGSSWSSNAVNQWVADVQPNGLQVVFTASGSAVGRKDFAQKTTDFAVTDIGFQGKDKISGEDDTSLGREYVYLPIVAGGTAFPYHLKVGGKLVRNLRLSGETVTKIFTNKIKNWNDPQITKDNNGKALPSKPIIPVVHSEGSGSSAQLTKYFDDVYPNVWRPFFGKAGFTEYFPRKDYAIAQNGSDGVMNYVASDAADGAIGYDEYSYALGKNYPVAKLENPNGYFTLPTQYNVAVALTASKINTDPNPDHCEALGYNTKPCYLLQNLHDVYRKADNRSYPLSSYSYMIIPTSASDPRMTTAKRQTLADYLFYSICEGQKEVGPIGYSPLPINLAQASFDQINKLKTADKNVDLNQRSIDKCGNPTFVAGQPKRNYLAEIAPQPPACDRTGAGPCVEGVGATNGNPGSKGSPTGSSSGGSGTTGGSSDGTTGVTSAGTTGGTTGAATTGAVTTGGTTTGTIPGATTGVTSDGSTVDGSAVPTELAADRHPISGNLLGPLAAVLLIAVVLLPPLLSRRISQRGGQP